MGNFVLPLPIGRGTVPPRNDVLVGNAVLPLPMGKATALRELVGNLVLPLPTGRGIEVVTGAAVLE